MANNSIQTRLSDLPSKASLSPDDILLIDDGKKTYSITYSDIKSDIEKSAVSSVDLDRLSNRLYAVENEVSPEVIVGLFSTDTDGVTTYQLDEPLAVGTRYKFTITNSTDLDDTTYRVYLGLDNINREIGVIHTDLATNYITFRADRAYDKVRVAGRPDYSLEITRTRHTKLNKPLVDGEPFDGNSGQYLRSLGNGSTEWVDVESALKFIKDSEGEIEIEGKTTQYTGAVAEGLVYDSIPEEHRNKATGNWAHVEGGAIELTVVPAGYTPETLYFPNTASGYSSHAEGADTVASGNYSHAEGRDTLASSGAAHAEGAGTKATHGGAHAEGGDTTASGPDSHAENWKTTASGRASHAEGNETTASADNSHSEGYQTTSSGQSAHAEGEGTSASSEAAHAEGIETVASGNASHAEGFSAKSIGTASHAQGGYTTANGAMSDATGMRTVAAGRSQHVFGELNIEDSANDETTRGTYIEIVGNGTPNNDMTDGTRSNARTLDWSGNEALAGSLTLGKGSANETTISPAELKSLKEATHLDSVRIAGQTLTPASNEMTVAQLKTALGTVSKTATGLVPALPNETTTTKYLRQDGTWAVPPDTDTNTTYTAGNGLSLSGTEFRNTGVTGIKTATDSDFRSGQITLTKDSVGLAAVENKSSATIREELTRENVLQALGYDPAGVLRYKGIQPTLADIQALTGSVGGDVWFCTGDNTQYAYNGSTWDSLGTIDLTGTITYIQNWVRDYVGNTLESD